MKKWPIIIAAVIAIGLAAASLIYDFHKNGNCVTIISGLWSAVATAAIGGIAYWQNKRYKQLADEANDAMHMPEIYRSTSFADEYNKVLEQYRAHVKGLVDLNSGYKWSQIIHLFFVRGPIVNLYVKSIECNSNVMTCVGSETISMRDETTPFNLSFEVPTDWQKKDNVITVTLRYENIYGIQYEKQLKISLYPENLKVDKITFEKARRVS